MNFWYVARPNELFLDIDNASRSLKHARARLQGAIECGKLDVAYLVQHPSKSKDHIHVIVTLVKEIANFDRIAWEVILHGDLYRGCCNLMRLSNAIPAFDVLISPFSDFGWSGKLADEINGYTEFADRFPDAQCNCKSKHNAATMQNCPAAIRLRGEFRNAGFFGKPSKNPCTIWPEP